MGNLCCCCRTKMSHWDWLSHPCLRPETAMISISALVTVSILGRMWVYVGRVTAVIELMVRDHMYPLPETVTAHHSTKPPSPPSHVPEPWKIKYQITIDRPPPNPIPPVITPPRNPSNPLPEPWPMTTKMKSSVSPSCR